MNRLLSILVLTLPALAAPASGQEGPPCYIRVTAEFIELPHPLCTRVISEDAARSGPQLHTRVRALVREGKARIRETCIAVASPGERATVESITEYIYPTENDYGGFCLLGSSSPGSHGSVPLPPLHTIRPLTPTAFETRHVGSTFEIAPNLGEDRQVIDLHFAPVLVSLLRHKTWTEHTDQWGAAPIRFPIFESLNVSTGITLLDGHFGFVGVLTPGGKDGSRDFSRKTMLFVRADVMNAG